MIATKTNDGDEIVLGTEGDIPAFILQTAQRKAQMGSELRIRYHYNIQAIL